MLNNINRFLGQFFADLFADFLIEIFGWHRCEWLREWRRVSSHRQAKAAVAD
jgi:hypothetical protein